MLKASFIGKEISGVHFNQELLQYIDSEDKLKLIDLKTGAEAQRIIKLTSSTGNFIIKKIEPQKAQEEAGHIKLINGLYPSFFPKMHALDSKQGVYIIDYIDGASLDSIIKFEAKAEFSLPNKDIIFKAIEHLSVLHNRTNRAYTSNYHEVIVIKRMNDIINCPIVNTHSSKINVKFLCEIEIFNSLFYNYLNKALSVYKKILPEKESIIHGDAHLGNIIAIDSCVKFIDPRIRWDSTQNKEPGYFDGLYDVSCLAHSIIANCILKTSVNNCKSDQLKMFFDWSMELLNKYNNSYSLGEKNRYIIYLACCLLGNLRYVEFTPNKDSFMRTVYAVAYLIEQI